MISSNKQSNGLHTCQRIRNSLAILGVSGDTGECTWRSRHWSCTRYRRQELVQKLLHGHGTNDYFPSASCIMIRVQVGLDILGHRGAWTADRNILRDDSFQSTRRSVWKGHARLIQVLTMQRRYDGVSVTARMLMKGLKRRFRTRHGKRRIQRKIGRWRLHSKTHTASRCIKWEKCLTEQLLGEIEVVMVVVVVW